MSEPTSILVVDDSPSKRYVICSWLRRGGYQLTEAGTGAEALERMKDTRVDLVVLDVRLPDMSGFAVCEQIKGDPRYAAIPVIHVSAAAIEMVDRTQGLARGADAYLVEPIDPEELLATVHAILRYYRGRQVAERLAARLSVLARLGVELNTAANVSALLADAALGTAAIFQCAAVVCAQDADGHWLAAGTGGPAEWVSVQPWSPRVAVLPPHGMLAMVTAEDTWLAQWLGSTPYFAAAGPGRPDRDPTYVILPAAATEADDPVLRLLSNAVASAMETLRAYAVEHHLALTLQQSLLPRRLPAVAGVDMATRYLPASDSAEIGGDFYELSELDGVLLAAIGDIGGHSLHAATIMAEVRHATRAYAAEGHPPASIVDRLGSLMLRWMPNEIATVCVLLVDPLTGVVRWANAGHPPPLVITGDEVVQLRQHGALLGLSAPAAAEHVVQLSPGSTLLLYTDGLVERRGEHFDQGLARLLTSAADPEPDLDAYCDRLVREVALAERTDDVALVALRRQR